MGVSTQWYYRCRTCGVSSQEHLVNDYGKDILKKSWPFRYAVKTLLINAEHFHVELSPGGYILARFVAEHACCTVCVQSMYGEEEELPK
jgi:hypothetical protein